MKSSLIFKLRVMNDVNKIEILFQREHLIHSKDFSFALTPQWSHQKVITRPCERALLRLNL